MVSVRADGSYGECEEWWEVMVGVRSQEWWELWRV